MRKTAAARFCGACGYELARVRADDECPMCARFEQLRIEFTVPRPSELAGLRTGPDERLDVNQPVASEDRPATASEYRAVLAAWRARTASADGGSGGPAATVIRTPSLRHPARAPIGAPTAALTSGSPASPNKPRARRKDRPTTVLTSGSPASPNKPRARRKDRPTTALTSGSPAPPNKPIVAEVEPEPAIAEIRSSAAAEVEHTPAAGIEIEPVRSRRRVVSEDDDTAFEPVEAPPEAVAAEMEPEPVADEVEPEPEPGARRNYRRPTPPPTQDGAGIWSAEKEITALPAPEAHQVMGAQAIRHRVASSRRRVMLQAAIGAVVGVTSALIGATVALLLS